MTNRLRQQFQNPRWADVTPEYVIGGEPGNAIPPLARLLIDMPHGDLTITRRPNMLNEKELPQWALAN